MTDYHSPWRFPAIKPYSDEKVEPNGTATRSPGLLPISYEKTGRSTGERSVSDIMRQMYR